MPYFNLYKKTIYFLTIILVSYFSFPLYLIAAPLKNQQPAAKSPTQEILIKLKNSPKVYRLACHDGLVKNCIENNLSNRSIEYIEPNYTYHIAIEPNDAYYTQQVYLSSIRANLAWNHTIGSRAVVIAVIDSGVDIDHPDLKNNIWHNPDEIPGNGIDDDHNGYVDDYSGWDFVTRQADPRPKFGKNYSYLGINHGTIVAGVVAAQGNNRRGITGVTWHSKIMPLRVLDATGTGNTLNVAKAIDYAVANGADIINLSFVGSGRSITLQQAIQRANQAGVLVVAAAGNEVDHGLDMTSQPRYPVCHDGGFGSNWVIGVGSLDNQDHLASFSNYGKCVDLVAPGVGIFSTLYKNSRNIKFSRSYGGYWSGTSVSAPQVSGVAALIKSLRPDLSLAELKKILLSGTDKIDYLNLPYKGKLGQGKLDAYKAVLNAQRIVSQVEHSKDMLITGAGSSGGPHVRVFSGLQVKSQFFAFEKNNRFGVKVASYDFDHDGRAEIIAFANSGEQPWIKIYNSQGTLEKQFLAFDKTMRSGINVAVGDLNNDGRAEIVAVAEKNFSPLVKIFDIHGRLKQSFYAFNPYFKGGLSVAVADINDDHFDEIVIGTGHGTPSTIKIFNYQGKLISEFMPYQPTYMQGVHLAAGDINGDGLKEIIVGTRFGGSPQVRVFDWFGRLKLKFLAYHSLFHGGVNVAAGDLDGDGIDEIITGAGPGGGPHVRVFNTQGRVIMQFFAYQKNFHGGVFVASGK